MCNHSTYRDWLRINLFCGLRIYSCQVPIFENGYRFGFTYRANFLTPSGKYMHTIFPAPSGNSGCPEMYRQTFWGHLIKCLAPTKRHLGNSHVHFTRAGKDFRNVSQVSIGRPWPPPLYILLSSIYIFSSFRRLLKRKEEYIRERERNIYRGGARGAVL